MRWQPRFWLLPLAAAFAVAAESASRLSATPSEGVGWGLVIGSLATLAFLAIRLAHVRDGGL